ncbi:MAG: glycoside hydrolase family 43 protein [Acidimicrobiales bacterium]
MHHRRLRGAHVVDRLSPARRALRGLGLAGGERRLAAEATLFPRGHRRSATEGPVRLSPPAAPGAFPDPFVVAAGGRYLAFATNGEGRNVRVRESPDLRQWQERPDALPELPPWARPGRTWSPAVLHRGGRWVMWYTACHAATGCQAISAATSVDPLGPYRDDSTGSPAILQSERGGSIDPSPFVDGDGTPYLVWKAGAGRAAALYGAPLEPGGTAPAGGAVALLRCDQRWERPLVEAPCLARAGDRYLLFYSGSRWQSARYAIGYAVADEPLGPWRKVTTRRPWASSAGDVSGPGGQEVFTGLDGERYLAYHGWATGAVGGRAGRRTLRIGHLDLDAGAPRLAPLTPADT